MADTPNPRLRRRIELALGLVAPVLDLILAAADALSRLLASEDNEVIVRMARPGEAAPRGMRPRS